MHKGMNFENDKTFYKVKLRFKTLFVLLAAVAFGINAQNNVAEEVAWVVGDEPIFKSDIEQEYMQAQYEKSPIQGNPYCVIPERMAIDKLFLHQAKIDTVEVTNSMIAQNVDARINYFIANLGSKEKVEEYFRKSMPELREQLMNMVRDQYTIQEVQQKLTKNVKATPADVRRYFNSLPADSLPYIPKEVEVQIITINPRIPQQEIDEVKSRLRDYAQKVNNGESDFSTLAILYSEDPGTSVYGGETGFRSRSELLPEYATAAFNLNDNKKVSKIVQTDDGYHIIQLIEKRGDRINTRHILLKPKVSETDLNEALSRLDTLRADVVDKKLVTFGQAAQYVSQDKDSKNNDGLMLNEKTRTNLFEMADLPAEVAKIVDTLAVGGVSKPFVMLNSKTNSKQVSMVRLSRRIEGHKADLANDYQTLKNMCENSEKEKIIENWVKEKQKNTYVYIEDGWRNCEFRYDWLKTKNSKN